MPRKRKKRRLKPQVTLWFFFLVNLGFGLMMSPVTAIVKVRVEGAAQHDQARISQILSKVENMPAMQVNVREIESQLMEAPDVYSASFERNVFGRALATLTYRVPVAQVRGFDLVYLGENGTVYQAASKIEGLPTVVFPQSAIGPSAMMVNTIESRRLAELCKNINEYKWSKGCVVEVDSLGTVCLNNLWETRVILGSTEKLAEKIREFQKIVERKPELLTHSSEINLTVPTRPTYKSME